MHIKLRTFFLVMLFPCLAACQTTYSASKRELVNAGSDHFFWEFYPSKTLDVYEDEKLKSDLNSCVKSLRNKFRKPKDLASGQEQIRKCMKSKDWNLLEAIQVT